MKILHIGKYYPPYRGGMETALANLAEGLLDAGCEVSLVTAGDRRTDQCEVICGPQSGRTGRLVRAGVRGVFNSQPVTPGMVGLLRRELDLFRPDLVQLHLPNPLAAAAWLALEATGAPHRPPLTIWYHADITRQRLGRRLLSPVLNRCLARAAGISVSSTALADLSPVLAPYRQKVAVIPFGIQPQPWLGVVPQLDGPFLFVGRLVGYKGVAGLFEALAAVPGAALVVVGEGPLRETLRKQGERLGILPRVSFVDTLDENGIAGHLGRARALVLPSIDASEAFGLVQLEAMGAGVPVIATDLPTGVPEVGVAGVTGLLVPPGDSQALAAALSRLHGDQALARRLGQAGRERFRSQFTRATMIARLVAWYAEILQRETTRKVPV